MERLTEWNESSHKHAYYPRCFEGPCYGRGCKIKDCPFETAVCERLAAYEDTGLMPEEVLPKDKADEIALKLMRLADLESLCNYARLRELAEAERDALREKVPQWVSVEERLPIDRLKKYLVAFRDAGGPIVDMARYFPSDGWTCDNWDVPQKLITHWMPLPGAPEDTQ